MAALIESDDFFARQMRRAGNVILALTPEVTPPDLFATNALALGDISTEKDADGILRRIKSLSISATGTRCSNLAADPEFGVDLEHARIAPGKILLPQTGTHQRHHRAAGHGRKF